MGHWPAWLEALEPIREPRRQPICAGSPVEAWHVDVAFTAWALPDGRILEGKETWNGKALVHPANSSLERSVGEVELAERLRRGLGRPTSYWTAGRGNPPEIWRPWAFRKELRELWFSDVDRQIRCEDPALAANAKGLPDVVSWQAGASDMLCVEYKGPSPTNPRVVDAIRKEQERWLYNAVRLGFLDSDRYAVVVWKPSDQDIARLLAQATSSRSGKAIALARLPGEP